MISLNLLSPTQKAALEARIVYALLERMMIVIVSSTLVVTIVLLVVKTELTKRLSDAEARRTLSSEYVSVNKETSQLNQSAARIGKISSFAKPVTPLIFDIVKRVPTGIHLSSVSYDVKSASMSINGNADTRARLLEFSEALRGSPYVQKVDSPISNLFQKTDVSFNLQAIIAPKP